MWLAVMCKRVKSNNVLLSETVSDESKEILICNLFGNIAKPYKLKIQFNNKIIYAQIDTGSELTVTNGENF